MDAPLGVPILRSIEDVYGEAAAEEEAFDKALDSSLAPRAPEMLFDLAAGVLGSIPLLSYLTSAVAKAGMRSSYRADTASRWLG